MNLKKNEMKIKKILVTGANGFVGNELIKRLLQDESIQVIALVRKAFRVNFQAAERVTILQGDLLQEATLQLVPELDAAYYLVHGLNGSDADFEYEESLVAVNFIKWMRRCNCRKIIYLGALGEMRTSSRHLRSRRLSGEILRLSAIPCVEFRASIILGAKSTSFEMMKALGERLPVIPRMKKLDSQCQPLGIEDLMSYLLAAIPLDSKESKIIEVGGPDVLSYGELLELYLQVLGQKKPTFQLPDLDDRVLKEAIDFLIPEMAEVGKKLYESLEYPTVVREELASQMFPGIKPIDALQAMKQAIALSSSSYLPLRVDRDTLKWIEKYFSSKTRVLIQWLWNKRSV